MAREVRQPVALTSGVFQFKPYRSPADHGLLHQKNPVFQRGDQLPLFGLSNTGAYPRAMPTARPPKWATCAIRS